MHFLPANLGKRPALFTQEPARGARRINLHSVSFCSEHLHNSRRASPLQATPSATPFRALCGAPSAAEFASRSALYDFCSIAALRLLFIALRKLLHQLAPLRTENESLRRALAQHASPAKRASRSSGNRVESFSDWMDLKAAQFTATNFALSCRAQLPAPAGRHD